MAQSDSQHPEFEESESSNIDSVVSSAGGDDALESTQVDQAEADKPSAREREEPDDQGSSEGDFGGELEDMLGAIEIENDPIGAELSVLDNDDDDRLSASDARQEGESNSVEAVWEDDEEEVQDEMTSSLPTPEELLMQAGSLLNDGDFQLPVEDEVSPGEEESDLQEEAMELMEMPGPQALMSEARGQSEEIEAEVETADDELMAMPDPQTLMNSANEIPGEASEAPQPKSASNIADRAGVLLPPPPAPVVLDDDEIDAEEPIAESEELEKPVEEASEESDPVGGDIPDLLEDESLDGDSSLEGFNTGLDEAHVAEALANDSASIERHAGEPSETVSSAPRGIVRRTLQSTALAAGLLLIGLGLTLTSVKEELYEYFQEGDLGGSTLSRQIAGVAMQVFDDLADTRHYHIGSFDAKIQQASENEVQVEVIMNAQLTRDLYLPVDDAFVYAQMDFDRDDLAAAASLVLELFPKSELTLPPEPWGRLFKKSAQKGDSYPFTAIFRLARETDDEAWMLSDLHVEGRDSDSIWGKGDVLDLHSENSFDVESLDFRYKIRNYETAGLAYLKQAKAYQDRDFAEEQQRARQLEEQRSRLASSLSKGSYYKGMAIIGEDGLDIREISLLITETRNGGGIVNGILKLESGLAPSKHFTGVLDIVENEGGRIQGLLSLTTVAFADQPNVEAPSFFKPGTVSRIALRTDGNSLEGDTAEISLRLVRSL